MNLPFTTEQFFEVFKKYNLAIFPLQLVFYLLALISIFLAIKKRPFSNKAIVIILSTFWVWIGIIYHFLFFSTINRAAYLFGIFNILQAALFLFFGFLRNKILFHFKPNVYGFTGSSLILYSLVIYPLLGHFLHHTYPSSPTFGLPCPTTIFTFGLLLWTDKRCPAAVIIIPFIWAIIGFFAAVSLNIYEDMGLLISGVLAISMILVRNKRLERSETAIV